jgi:non-lysosomal glucosylceramidase
MAKHLGEDDFAAQCRRLFKHGRSWMDANLFNGEYFVQDVCPSLTSKTLRLGFVMSSLLGHEISVIPNGN